ncbi:MAG: Smr/MutS family protein [Pseudomonadota bacterium]
MDGTWDRSFAKGAVAPDRIVDLHGDTLARAYERIDAALETAVRDGERVLLLVTGKAREGAGGRGAIRAAVGDWLAASRHARAIAAVRAAHPRHGGAGALYVVLRKR